MKTRLLFLPLLIFCFYNEAHSQLYKNDADTLFFNYSYWNGIADKQHLSKAERAELIDGQKKLQQEQQAHQHNNNEEMMWVAEPAAKGFNPATINAGSCANIDFEAGTMSGWVRSTGYNPLTNTLGCCPNANGDQTIMTGGNDPYGGFPRVYPGGGSFSLRLGSTATGGIADRISQTFFVTPANVNFTYRYALVLNDGGHAGNQQPRFTSEIVDTLGNAVPCTFYQASAGTNTFGLISSTLGAPSNNSPVSYKNWTSVALDLTPNIGQNVTLRFTVYDCGPSGHFAYAYIDGQCTNFITSVADTTCPNVPLSICAPSGFSTTTWNGPGVTNDPNQCISVSTPGTYTCTTILVPGCPGPTFTHTLTTLPNPVLSFTPATTGPCSKQYTFNNTSSISGGSITVYEWNFGDGTTATSPGSFVPTHTYLNPGTYAVKLRAFTNRGCKDSVITPITIFPVPNLSYSPPSNCINTVVQFTNTSSISLGSITGYTWSLGNGPTSNSVNPTNSYTTSGNYTIVLNAISNQGCAASLTQTLGIFPPPIVSFTANPLCDVNGTSFSPATSTAIVSGSLVSFNWNFGDGGTSTQPTPVHTYTAPGIYTVSFSAMSNHYCSASAVNVLTISPSPTVAFATTSINACSNNFTFTNNSGIAPGGSISYTWNFGGSNTSTSNAAVLTHTFPGIGNYTVSLLGLSNMGCGDTVVKYISIYPYPVINFSVPAACENAIFSVSTTAVSGSVTSYNWNFGDIASGPANTSTLQNPTHYYATTNLYNITLNIVSNLNCPSSTVVPVVVYPNPTSIFSFGTANNCSLPYNYTSSSTVSTIGASSVTAFKWTFGSAGTSTVAAPSMSFPGPGSYSVSLIAITNHNCSDTTSAIILVHPNPQIAFSVQPVCQNLPATFTATSFILPVPSATSSINSYTWNYGDGAFSTTLTPPPHTYTASGNYVVSMAASSNMGCVATATQNLLIHAVPLVNFTTSSNMCFGNSTQFLSTSSVLPPSIIYSYNWNFGDSSPFGSNPNTSHTYSSSSSFVVTFSATTNNECVATQVKTVTIHPLPVASFTANGGCLNMVSQFNATTSIAPTGTISAYSWDFGDGSPLSATQNPPHTYTSSGSFNPGFTVTSTHGCTTSATGNVLINPLPVIAFSPSSACVGTAIQFTNSSFPPMGSITGYTWDFGDGNNSNTTQPLHTYTLSQVTPYNITLSAISSQGCVNSGTNSLMVNPYPTSTLTTINSSCINDLVSFNPNLSITYGSVPSTTINFGDGAVTTFTSPLTLAVAHTYTAYNTYTVTIIANSDKSCARTFTSSVIIYPKPFVNYTPAKFCHRDSTLFTNTSIIPTGTISGHYWFFSDGSSSSALKDPKYKFTSPGTYSVFLTELSNPEPGLTCSLTTVKLITINPLPVPSFSASTVCEGLPTLYNNSTPQQGIIGWSWDFNNDGAPDNSLPNPVFTFSTSGSYTTALIAKNNFNCSDTVRNPVVVYAKPSPAFAANNVCLGGITSFTNQTTPASGSSSTSYTWSVNSSSFSTAQHTTYTFSAFGLYQVELTSISDQGCVKKYVNPVTVHELPAVKYLANNACLNSATSFTNLSSISSGSITGWRWDFENNGSWDDSLAYHANKVYTKAGVFTCKLQATSNNNCNAVIINSVVVHDLPFADFTMTTKKCNGDPLSFTNLSTCPDGTVRAYRWDFDSDGLQDSELKNPKYTFTNNGTRNIKLDVTSQYGCVGATTKSVYINPKATPIITSDVREGCPDLCVGFKDISVVPANYTTTNTWDFGDGSPVNKDFKNIGHCYKTGTYTVTLRLVTDSGCASVGVFPDFITVYNQPVAGFVVDPPEVDENQPIVEIKSIASDAAFTRYYVNDGTNYTGKGFTHNFKKLDGKTKPMIVQTVKNNAGCADTVYTILDIKPAFVIYVPNVFTPNSDGLNDNFQAKGVGILKFNMQIYDRWGHQVYATGDINQPWDGDAKKGKEAAKEDVYIWKAQVVDVFNKTHDMVGHVTVLR